MKVHGKIWGAGRGPREATPIASKIPLVGNLTNYEKAFLSLLTTEEWNATTSQIPTELSTAKAKWCPFNTSQPILSGETNNVELGLRWGWMYILSFKRWQRFSPVGELAVGVRTREVWRMTSFQQRENVIYHFTQSDIAGKWKIKRMLNHFRSPYFQFF